MHSVFHLMCSEKSISVAFTLFICNKHFWFSLSLFLLLPSFVCVSAAQHSVLFSINKGENCPSLITTQAALSQSFIFFLSTWHLKCSGTHTCLFSPNIKLMSCSIISLLEMLRKWWRYVTCKTSQKRPWLHVCLIAVYCLHNIQKHVKYNSHTCLLPSFSQTVSTASELRKPIYWIVAAKAIDYEQMLLMMAGVKWDIREIMSQHNVYVDVLLKVTLHKKYAADCWCNIWCAIL